MNLHKIYRHKKSISVSCFYDRDGNSNHTLNFILSTYWNNNVLKECAAKVYGTIVRQIEVYLYTLKFTQ